MKLSKLITYFLASSIVMPLAEGSSRSFEADSSLIVRRQDDRHMGFIQSIELREGTLRLRFVEDRSNRVVETSVPSSENSASVLLDSSELEMVPDGSGNNRTVQIGIFHLPTRTLHPHVADRLNQRPLANESNLAISIGESARLQSGGEAIRVMRLVRLENTLERDSRQRTIYRLVFVPSESRLATWNPRDEVAVETTSFVGLQMGSNIGDSYRIISHVARSNSSFSRSLNRQVTLTRRNNQVDGRMEATASRD